MTRIDRLIPQPFSDLIDGVMEDDAEWFRVHPRADVRFRPYVPGEAWPLRFPEGTRVRVTQVGPGVRIRNVLGDSEGAYDADEAAIVAEHGEGLPPGLLAEGDGVL